MAVTTRAMRLKQLITESPAVKLLRAGDTLDHAAVVMALLMEHLGGDERRVNSDDLHARIDADLEQLRAIGLALPRTARAYVAQWRDAGFVIRRASANSRSETLELSSAALMALRFVDEIESPRQMATESRLASLAAQLRQLAIDTDPESSRRLERLRSERDRIDAQIAAIHAGAEEPLAGDRAEERLRDLVAQAMEVPDDFTRIRADFEALNVTLRKKVIDADTSQKTVLDDIFRNVDLIADSPAGQSFDAFTKLILDPSLGTAFEDDIDQVLERDFARHFPPGQRQALRNFIRTLKDRAAEIQSVATEFARGLRRYVESQDYQRDRLLRAEINQAMQAAIAASRNVKPFHRVDVDLPLTRVEISSPSAIRLLDPTEYDASEPLEVHETGTADLEALKAMARLTEIDFDELRSNVNAVLNGRQSATPGEVLEAYPPTQGLASIVGLMSLAATYGEATDAHEIVTWDAPDKARRAAEIDGHLFTERLP